MINPYEALHAHFNLSDAEIKACYKQQAAKAHPDKGGTADAFHRIKIAYDTIKNSKSRHRHREELRCSGFVGCFGCSSTGAKIRRASLSVNGPVTKTPCAVCNGLGMVKLW